MSIKRAPGRPKLPPGKGKQETITIRLSGEERTKIEVAAKMSSEKLSRWVRKVLLDAADRQ